METRRVIVSVGVGTAVLFGLGVLTLVLAVVGISALHFLPTAEPAAKLRDRVFPQVKSVPNTIPKQSIDEAQNFGPLNQTAREEKKSDVAIAERSTTLEQSATLVATWLACKFPAIAAGVLQQGSTIIDVDPKDYEERKTQSECPTCPNYRPPSAELLLVPSAPELPRSPTYYPPQPTPTPPTSSAAAGTWFTGPRGTVWIPRGSTYEHDSGLIRDATGKRSIPLTPESARRPVTPAGLPPLAEQPPLADDNPQRVRPAVPDFTKSPRGERKTGGYACANCKRLTVGDQWATQWTEQGTPISYLCAECWEKLTPEQRQAAYVDWYRRAVQQ